MQTPVKSGQHGGGEKRISPLHINPKMEGKEKWKTVK